jgi:hypothetical protein
MQFCRCWCGRCCDRGRQYGLLCLEDSTAADAIVAVVLSWLALPGGLTAADAILPVVLYPCRNGKAGQGAHQQDQAAPPCVGAGIIMQVDCSGATLEAVVSETGVHLPPQRFHGWISKRRQARRCGRTTPSVCLRVRRQQHAALPC